jgi:hypothetical protein
MEQELKNIIQLMQKIHNVKVPIELNEISLNKQSYSDSFKTFLIEKRIVPLIIMRIIFEKCLESSCFIGYKNVKFVLYDELDEEIEEEKNLGSCVLKEVISGEDFFNLFLSNLSISTVEIRNIKMNENRYLNLFGKHSLPSEAWDVSPEGPVFFVKEPFIIFDGNKAYATKEMMPSIHHSIGFMNQIFNNFVEKTNDAFVSHEIYINWLLRCFPGMIHIRSIAYGGDK